MGETYYLFISHVRCPHIWQTSMAEPVIQSWLYLYTRSTQIPRPDPPFPNFFLYHIRVAIDPINQIYGKARTIRGWNVCVEREELSKTCESFQSQWQIGCPNLNWDHIKQTSYSIIVYTYMHLRWCSRRDCTYVRS